MENKNKKPYGTFGLSKIEAPKKPGKDTPKGSKITGKGDLRIGGRK